VSGNAIGVLSVDSTEVNGFDENAKRYLELMAAQLATAFTLASSIEALRDAERQNQAHMEAMAHQLIAPLSAIRIGCEALLEGRTSTERARKALVSLAALSRIAARTASNFGILANLLVGRGVSTRIQKPQRDIVRLILDIARDYQPMAWANEKNIIVCVRGVNANLHDAGASLRDGILVDYDDRTFPQVMANVVENAVKYSDDYSSIGINVDDRLGNVRIEVVSQGIRLPREEVEKIFEYGYRSIQAQRKIPPGTGIGLPIARSIMQAHGGKLFALPTDEQGRTAFVIELPEKRVGGAL
jgi:signal transduction histidine kinase